MTAITNVKYGYLLLRNKFLQIENILCNKGADKKICSFNYKFYYFVEKHLKEKLSIGEDHDRIYKSITNEGVNL